MAFNVDQFRSTLRYDGARPNLFEVFLRFPDYVELGPLAGSQARFMCKTAQLPGSTMGVVEVPYFGRQVKVAGNRTFAEWSVTIINDEDFTIRNAFERWHRGINGNVSNLREAPSSTGANTYAVDASVYQYSKMGGIPIKSYKFTGLFPSDIAAVDLDWGSNDSIEEFSVTLSYQYWVTQDTSIANPA